MITHPSIHPRIEEMKPSDHDSRNPMRAIKYLVVADRIVFAGCGAITSLLLVYFSFNYSLTPNPNIQTLINPQQSLDSHSPTFYDDPSVSYTIDAPISDWDEKRRHWLRLHPSLAGGEGKVLMITGSAPGTCRNPGGDHLLLRFYKNKADYCRIHGYDLFYNTALLHPKMPGAWAKIPVIRSAMVAHPESEWIWWVDSDAAITDVNFRLPFHRYSEHNLVVPGWKEMVYKYRSWVGINAGVFLIRNCQWSLDFLSAWANMGPQSPEYEAWEKEMRSEITGKASPDSDDQSALVLLLLKQKDKFGDKVYIESAYDLHGYWETLVPRLPNATELYREMERKEAGMRQRRAEKAAAEYGEMVEKQLEEMVVDGEERRRRRRPFVTHFTGCQPCVGGHNPQYTPESCKDGMDRALDFADDQVLRAFGFQRSDTVGGGGGVRPLRVDGGDV